MQDTNIFIEKIDGTKRQIGWFELNQLKKDILWIFNENGGELHNSFVPDYSFTLPYWEYASINGDKYFYDDEKNFYREGSLIIILCMLAENLDIQGGSQLVFGDNDLKVILNYVKQFEPTNKNQNSLKELAILGLSIAVTITKVDIARNEDLEHPEMDKFFSLLQWVDKTFIQAHYKSKLT
jgi:hypothetical protein